MVRAQEGELFLSHMLPSAAYWIRHLQLSPHPEGGFFKETYRSPGQLSLDSEDEPNHVIRNFSTSIYFLLEYGNFSAFHRIKSDEMWHFYAGNTLEILILEPNQGLYTILLGNDLEKKEQLQAVVPAGHWFAARVLKPESYALVGCTVAPGFDFQDFELARAEDLLSSFPQHETLIRTLTRE